jgi:hypothetical protein
MALADEITDSVSRNTALPLDAFALSRALHVIRLKWKLEK